MGRRTKVYDEKVTVVMWHNSDIKKPMRWEEVICHTPDLDGNLRVAYYTGKKWVCSVTSRTIPDLEIKAWCYIPSPNT